MAGYISTSSIGNGTTAYGTDIVVKDLDLDVSNRVKDDTPVLNMCMTKKRKVNSTLPLWTDDIYRLPELIEKLIGSKGVEYLTPISLSTEGGGYTSVPVGKKSKE